MKTSENLLPLSNVRRLLGRWSDVVERCLRGGRAAKKVSGYEYEQLHSELMRQCYLYLQSDEPGKRYLFQRVYTMLSPWATLPSLRKANPHVLATLLPECLDLEQSLRRLDGSAARFSWRLVAVCLLAALAGGLIYYAVDSGVKPGAVIWSEWRVAVARSKLTLARMTLLEKVSIVTLVVVLAGLWMSWSVKKS